jgi:hypothetical protein
MKAATAAGIPHSTRNNWFCRGVNQRHPSVDGCGRRSRPTVAQRDEYYADLTDPEHPLVDRRVGLVVVGVGISNFWHSGTQ